MEVVTPKLMYLNLIGDMPIEPNFLFRINGYNRYTFINLVLGLMTKNLFHISY